MPKHIHIWNEKKHPRAKGGEFAAGSGSVAAPAPVIEGSPTAAKWAAEGEKHGLTSTFVPEDKTTPRDLAKMTPQQIAALPLVYHGVKEGHQRLGYMFVTKRRSGAEFHGNVQAYRVLPNARVHADIEADMKRNGLQTLNDPRGSSAIIHRSDLHPVEG